MIHFRDIAACACRNTPAYCRRLTMLSSVPAEKSIGVLGKYKVEYKSLGTMGPKYKMGTKGHTVNWPICQPVDSHGKF